MSQDKLINKLHEIMSKSRRSLDDATILYKKGSYDSSVSLAYYAAFHAIQALLLTKGTAFSKHAQVKGAFNKEFIHLGIFPKNFTAIIERLFKDRQIGDYEYGEHIKGDQAKKDISDAKTVIKAIAEYLGEKYSREF